MSNVETMQRLPEKPAAMSHQPIVTLLTDYGTSDYFVAAVKGAILSIAPSASIIDMTHDIEPQNIAGAAFVLRQSFEAFPRGTIHVAVVDPGVGTRRQILLGAFAGHWMLAPDNGLLSWVDHDCLRDGLWAVENEALWRLPVSPTFHGRDIFAPVAGHLAGGLSPDQVGRPLQTLTRLPIPFRAKCISDELAGAIIHIDRFGNLVSNIHADQILSVADVKEVRVGSERVQVGATFAVVAPGEPVCYLGSAGFLEIAVRGGSALHHFGPNPPIHVKL